MIDHKKVLKKYISCAFVEQSLIHTRVINKTFVIAGVRDVQCVVKIARTAENFTIAQNEVFVAELGFFRSKRQKGLGKYFF